MVSIGAYKAKTHLSQLLAQVEKGERVSISRRGKVVALLLPAPSTKNESLVETIKKLKTLRMGITLGKKFSLKTLIKEGRRF